SIATTWRGRTVFTCVATIAAGKAAATAASNGNRRVVIAKQGAAATAVSFAPAFADHDPEPRALSHTFHLASQQRAVATRREVIVAAAVLIVIGATTASGTGDFDMHVVTAPRQLECLYAAGIRKCFLASAARRLGCG